MRGSIRARLGSHTDREVQEVAVCDLRVKLAIAANTEILASQLCELLPHNRISPNLGHEGGRRLAVDLERRADLLDDAVVHDHDPVGHGQRFLLVVGHHDRGDPQTALQLLHLVAQVDPHLGVERRERFVEQQERWIRCQRPDERDPLDQIAEEYAERLRRGERPTVEEYASRYPELSDELFDLLSSVEAIEALKRRKDSTSASASAIGPVEAPERLGDFRVVREVGRGGMGIVYEAVQESLDRRVALKVLPESVVADAKRIERFEQEARAAARVRHPGIAAVYDADESCIAMQLVDGPPLSRVPRDDRRRLVTWIRDAARAVHAAHEQGVIHRDLKPHNLMVDREDRVVTTRLDETALEQLALETDGFYARSTSSGMEVEEIARALAGMDATEFGTTLRVRYEERYQIPLGLALAALIAEACLSDRRRRRAAPTLEGTS